MLNAILSRWLKVASNNDEQAQTSNLPKHEQTRLMVENIAIRKGRHFNPIKAASVHLQCSHSDILAFIERIDGYSAKLEQSEGLTPQECFAEMKTVTLDQFFTDAQGMYIPLEVTNNFIESCRSLFAAVNGGLASNNPNVGYSIRLMGKCFSSIQNVCKAIEEAAH